MGYYKPQSPLKKGNNYVYPLTTYDQIILKNGERWTGPYDDLEVRLLIAQRAQTSNYSATFSSSGWTGEAPYEQTVALDGVLSTDVPIVDIDMSKADTTDSGNALAEAWNCIGRVTASDGAVTAFCYNEKPTVDITVVLKVVR